MTREGKDTLGAPGHPLANHILQLRTFTKIYTRAKDTEKIYQGKDNSKENVLIYEANKQFSGWIKKKRTNNYFLFIGDIKTEQNTEDSPLGHCLRKPRFASKEEGVVWQKEGGGGKLGLKYAELCYTVYWTIQYVGSCSTPPPARTCNREGLFKSLHLLARRHLTLNLIFFQNPFLGYNYR